MSLDKMKKQAKNLQRLLPDFVSQNPSELKLAHCQELVARIHGFPSWHAACAQATPQAQTPSQKILVLPISIRVETIESIESIVPSELGNEATFSEHAYLRIETNSPIDAEIDALDDYMQRSEWYAWNERVPPAELSEEMFRLCEQLLAKQPAFLDGYAHLAVALMYLGRYDEVVARLQPIYEAIVAAFPDGKRFKGRVSYGDLSNRPFHRIAANLVIAAYELRTPEGAKIGSAIAKQMYRWWPSDNIGFRFLLTEKSFTEGRR